MSERRVLHASRALVEGRLVRSVAVEIADGRVAAVRPAAEPPPDAETLGGTLSPGFVDAHVHGGGGADFMDGGEEAVRAALRFHLAHGTTAVAATSLSGSREAVAAAVAAVAAVAAAPGLGEAAVVAVHLEGPYLSPQRPGAQDPASLRAADPEEVEGWLALAGELPVRMTVAPEVGGVLDLIGARAGRVGFTLGHTAATAATCREALDRGARGFTHLFNAMPPLHHREPGPVGVALADGRAEVELIADGEHVDPGVLALCHRICGDRLLLVSDAMRAAGCAPGTYRLHRHAVRVEGGTARLADGTLAGSLLTIDRAVRVMVQRAEVPLEAALRAATEAPARALGVDAGRLRPGAPADLVLLSEALEVERVWRRGEEVGRP